MRSQVLFGACALAACVVLANAGPAHAQAKGSAEAGAAKRANQLDRAEIARTRKEALEPKLARAWERKLDSVN